jgi:iron complex transport system substrate-binding protein
MKSKMLRIVPLVLVAILLASAVVGCTSNNSQTTPTPTPSTRQVTDLTGVVQIPYTVERVANSWPANNAIMLMLGACNKIVATTTVIQGYPWFYKICPHVKDVPAPFVSAKDVNIETLIGTNPDVVIYATGGLDAGIIQNIQAAGIPLVQVWFDNFENLKDTVRTTGKVLGAKEEAKANEYCTYLDNNLKKVTSITANISNEQKPRVLHTVGNTYLGVDGRNTIIDTWINKSGGINAAADYVDGNGKQITMEQLLVINPDIIIIGNLDGVAVKEQLMTDPKCSSLKAVQSGKVYINPKGVFSWDRSSAEEALQVLWAAKIIHPDKFQDIDIAKETKDFYAKFFGYNLTDVEVNLILNALPPE